MSPPRWFISRFRMHILVFVMIEIPMTQMNEVRVLRAGWCMTQNNASALLGHPFCAKHEIALPVAARQRRSCR